jgi:plastocyanin
MHTLALQLAPIVAAEKSKVPFYIAGGVLVAWALTVSLGLGMRRPRFPGGPSGERAVIAISAVLVLAALVTAVLTSGGAPTAGAASNAQATSTASAPYPSAPPASGSQPEAASAPSTSSAAAPPSTSSASPAPAKSSPAPATAGGAPAALKLAANPTGLLSFDSKQLSAKAGTVTITLTNASPVEHNVAVAQGATVLATTPTFMGGSRTLTLTLKPGTYTFYCAVPGHRQAGMEGSLKVS